MKATNPITPDTPFASLGARASAWLRARMPTPRLRGDPAVLGHRRVYILPTRYGLVYAGCLLLMLIGSINYQNNLGYMLTFLLTGLGLVAMVHTWRNLLGLAVHGGRAEPVFVGQEACFPLYLDNRGKRPRQAIRADAPEAAGMVEDVPANDSARLFLHAGARRRGVFRPGRITLSTLYPLGLFRAWGYVDTGIECLVYPTPAPIGDPPEQEVPGGNESGGKGHGVDDFLGLRPYRAGDSLKQIDWKALARERGLVSKEFGGDQTRRIALDWELLPGIDTETRLSLLCRFVLLADSQQQHYALKLPGVHIAESHGEKHKHACLAALARF